MMLRKIITLSLLLCMLLPASAQVRTVQNRPYTDLRPFHFGIHVGTHVQDMEMLNVGPLVTEYEDGTVVTSLITADQDRWDTGFNVGVSGEFRLHEHFQFRVSPAIFFGTRHIQFHNILEPQMLEAKQDLKTAYITAPLELIFSAPRFNNHRPYVFAGLSPVINIGGSKSSYFRLKPYGCFAEVGIGWDRYLPYFKWRPELKFMFGLGDQMDHDHASTLRDKTMLPYANSVSRITSKMFVLSFYFE